MNGEHVYLYALALIANPCRATGAGVDPRFPVERICSGQLAAVTSRVGLDQFDLNRFRGETPQDAQWLSRVAVRHNEIVAGACACPPVIPLRIGTVFRSRASMVAKMREHQPTLLQHLLCLGDRQEWAGKLYASKPTVPDAPTRPAPVALHAKSGLSKGAHYLERKRADYQRRSEMRASLPQGVSAVESALKERADECRRVRTLPAHARWRREKMLWNAALLISPATVYLLLSVAERVGRAARSRGLLLEITGPWPPYHFCPSLPI